MQPVPARHDFPGAEEVVLKLWEDIDAFLTSVKLSEGRPEYTFYDGPPFATGLPHYGHILAGTIKDTVTRYAHQTGHHVVRRFGWDCHGLPIEFEIDKLHGIKTKEDVLKFGIANYNEACRAIVMRYSSEWEKVVTRLGRWIDFKNDYKTMDKNFMESVWWVFKEIYGKGLVYRGFKVMPYSTTCTTPLSNFEANLNYKDIQDPAVIVNFPLVDEPEVSLLAWTTTPWTLPSNLALCVNPEADYVRVKETGTTARTFILMEARLSALFKEESEYTVLDRFKGSTLAGKKYTPLFDYFASEYPHAFKVLVDSYVTSESGTGIVHQAPGFGEDDYRVCLREGLIEKTRVPCPVDENGRYIDPISDFLGMYVKDADKPIIQQLKKSGRMINASTLNHSYPYCWRSDTPLIYRTVPSWFVNVESFRDRLIKNNSPTLWVPSFVKDRRFQNWLEDARDWAISRNRYWGTPLPIWVSDDYEEVVVVGSVAELEELAGLQPGELKDIHRHFIDHLEIPSKTGKGTLKRVSEVFDCWFESGSMPFAQSHYPFENKDTFDKGFPADFISEGIDQTRGWFYTLLVISTAVRDVAPFKNLICSGLVLAADGQKMSKRLQNYPDPSLITHKYGADSLRLYLINSPVVRAEELKFMEAGVNDIIKDVFNHWYHSYRMFTQQVARLNKKGHTFVVSASPQSDNVMDIWVMSSLQSLVAFVREEMAAYRLYTVVPRLVTFVVDLTKWYVRLNRRRFKGAFGAEAAAQSLDTLFHVMLTLCRALAPFCPFFVEYLYQNLKMLLPADQRSDSVHYLSYPEPEQRYLNEEVQRKVNRLQTVLELARVARERRTMPVRRPLQEIIIYHSDPLYLSDLESLSEYMVEQVNVKTITLKNESGGDSITLIANPNQKILGQRLRGDRKKVMDAIASLSTEELRAFDASGSITLHGHVITKDDCPLLSRYSGDTTNFEAAAVDDVIVVINLTATEELTNEYHMREFVNRVQRMRKAGGAQETQALEVYYEVGPNSDEFVGAIAAWTSHIEEVTHSLLKRGAPADASKPDTEGKVNGFTVKLWLGNEVQ